MERQLDAAVNELQSMRWELETMRKESHPIKTALQNAVKTMEKNIAVMRERLDTLYQAVDEQTDLYELEDSEEKWGVRYLKIAISWQANWANLATYFQYPTGGQNLDLPLISLRISIGGYGK